MASEPSAKLDGLSFSSGAYPRAAELARWTTGLLVAVLLSGAALLCWRRLAGALSNPLDPVSLLAVALPVAAMAAIARIIGKSRLPGARKGRFETCRGVLLSASVLTTGAALSLNGTSLAGLVALWGILIAEEAWAWRPGSFPGLPNLPRWRGPRFRPVRVNAPQAVAPHSPADSDDPIPVADGPPDETVTQKITRSQAADGTESISGWLRIPLAPGQRTANVHVAFCPPFPHTPRARVKQLDGPEARVKTVQLLPYGVRFDLKLTDPSESAAAVLLQFSAKAAPPLPAVPEITGQDTQGFR
jgi:hypothetical protein